MRCFVHFRASISSHLGRGTVGWKLKGRRDLFVLPRIVFLVGCVLTYIHMHTYILRKCFKSLLSRGGCSLLLFDSKVSPALPCLAPRNLFVLRMWFVAHGNLLQSIVVSTALH